MAEITGYIAMKEISVEQQVFPDEDFNAEEEEEEEEEPDGA